MNINIGLYNIFFLILLAGAAWCAWKISLTDWRRRIIPDVYLFPLLLLGLAIVAFFPWITNISDAIIAAICGYALAAIIGFIFELSNRKKNTSDAPIGLGDIKLIAVGGLWLGVTGLAITLFISCIMGIIWGKHAKQKFIPFAPFFIGAGILTLIAMTFLI